MSYESCVDEFNSWGVLEDDSDNSEMDSDSPSSTPALDRFDPIQEVVTAIA